MNFVESNQIDKQKLRLRSFPCHYIFVLDDSGSMRSDNRWIDLMTAFTTSIELIKGLPQAQSFIKISILLEGSTCSIYQENVTPSSVNLNIKPRYQGNNFADTFEKAYNLMTKYVNESKIKFVFMTDGGAIYPLAQVNQIKVLKNAYPDKIQYFGIEFQTNGDTMKLISKELDGKNSITHTATELTQAFTEIIDRKV